MRILRKIVGWLPYVGAMLVMIAVFEWFYYHVQGKSAVWGLNPRCIEPGSSGYCWKLDTSNMPWDATLATWLAQGAWYFALLAAFALSATLLVGAVAGATYWRELRRLHIKRDCRCWLTAAGCLSERRG